MVEADTVDIVARVVGQGPQVDTLRYSVSIKAADGEGGTVASGQLTAAEDASFSGDLALDAEGIYQLRLIAVRDGQTVAEAYRDFKYAFLPAPEPLLPLIEGDRTAVKLDAPDAPYSLVVDTAPGVRVEVLRGDALLGRATAVTDRVELDIQLVEGENPLTIKAWRRQASAERSIVIHVTIDGDAPRAPVPVDVPGLCRAGDYAKAWRARGRLGADDARALAPCLVIGAARAGAWRSAAELADAPAERLREWPLDALSAGAQANARQKNVRVRDRLWRAAAQRVATGGEPGLGGDEAEALGQRIRRSGADRGVLDACFDQGDADHPCRRLLKGMGDDTPPPVEPTVDREPVDGAPVVEAQPPRERVQPVPAERSASSRDAIVTACGVRDFRKAADAFTDGVDGELSRAHRLCVALGLRLSGRCGEALSVATPLVDTTSAETVPALQVMAGCQASSGRKDAAARSWQRAIELALSGASSFAMGPERVRRDLDAAGLEPEQRALAVKACEKRPAHTLCQAVVEATAPAATIDELCRQDELEAAARHPDAERVDTRNALCVAQGFARLGQPARARVVLRRALEGMGPSDELGRVSRLLASVSANREAVDAMKRAVEMMAQSLYVVKDTEAFYGEIRGVRGKSAVEEIIAPCRAASRRDACRDLLRHFDVAPQAPPPVARVEPPAPAPTPSPAQPSPAQPSPAQPSPAQPSPAQPSPAQPGPPKGDGEPDIIGRPVGSRFVLHLDSGKTLERATPSGAFTFGKDVLPTGAVRFTLSASGRKSRTGTINLQVRRTSEGPVRLYAHQSAAHADYSAGEQALARGDTAAAIAAFTKATRTDADFCLAYAYLGYAQGLAGQSNQARGSFARCESSLDNDLAAVATASLLAAVIDLRAGIGGSPDQIERLSRRLRSAYGRVRYANSVLPSTKRAAINLGTIYKVWNARGQTAYWRKVLDAEGPPETSERACKAALKAWRAIPGVQLRYVGPRLEDSRSDFAEERTQAMRELGAACK